MAENDRGKKDNQGSASAEASLGRQVTGTGAELGKAV